MAADRDVFKTGQQDAIMGLDKEYDDDWTPDERAAYDQGYAAGLADAGSPDG